jgi:transcriptional regulator with GAF, ATPase, and Fis domain
MAYNEQRHIRLRRLTKELNRQRKRQAKQIDILCNDFIAAQKDFIKKLNIINFTSGFYESILGATDLNSLLYTTVKLMKEELDNTNVTFFLRQGETFEVHIFESTSPVTLEKQHLENCLSPDVMDNICQANRVCTLEDMVEMGLEGSPAGLNNISAVTIPLSSSGSSVGFILVYRSSEKKITPDDLKNVLAVTSGLSQAIQSCRKLLHPSK